MEKSKAVISYLAWGAVSNGALRLYYLSPRKTIQDEFLALHRYALKRAHTSRIKAEISAGKAVTD